MSAGARRWLPWIALGVVAIVVIAFAAWPRSGEKSVAARTRNLASELRCVDCEGLSAADSSTSVARATRADIRRRLEAGESEAHIRQVYVDRYGESILLKPSGHGLGVVVWGLPVAVLLVGAGGIVLALRRWKRQPRLEPTAADEELVARVRGEA
jgi:cytochrome c-type biogenesis protein CcmH